MEAVQVSENEVRVGRRFFSNDDWLAICDSADSIVTDILKNGCVCGCNWKSCSLEQYINDESKSHCEELINDFGYSAKNVDWVNIVDQVFILLTKREEGKWKQ